MKDMEKIALGEGEIKGLINVPREYFIILHDYMAEVLNTANKLSIASEATGDNLSREECAGRILTITVIEMDKYAESNPDVMEELLTAEMFRKGPKAHVDTMYG